ncbi:hypothetical protein [Streptomyces katrae]|uniref:hypothetical protein n=1 Tax=Streptomyces katrae TaxID=68223 RepID=UPI000A7F9682|nr:hypothetical protein [Streptomyces katrae]
MNTNDRTPQDRTPEDRAHGLRVRAALTLTGAVLSGIARAVASWALSLLEG